MLDFHNERSLKYYDNILSLSNLLSVACNCWISFSWP